MARDSSKRRGKPRPGASPARLNAMNEGTDSPKPKRARRFRSQLSRRFTQLMDNPRLSGFRRWLDGTTTRLEAIERKIPPAWKKPVVRRSVVAVVLVVGSVSAVRVIASDVDKTLPNPNELQTFARPGTLTIRASDGTILHQLGPATREKLKIDQIPKRLIEAFIASEDRRFYDHSGVDLQGIARAVVRNFTSGELVEGGSTLTQQLARIVYLNQDRSIGRKVREALIAQKLEREVSKDQILEKYLNLVFLGSNAYGVADAAWVYFSKPVSQLTLGEIAMIAGLPPAPSVYSPLENLDKARERRNTVLDRMAAAGYISQAEADTTKAQPLTVKPSPPKNIQSAAPYFTYYVQQQVPKLVSKEALEAGGITVETSLNAQWQKIAEKAVRTTIREDGNSEGFKQGALVAIDPRNGEVRAMVGGYDFYKDSMFNRATQAQRQPGSTFKSIVYATAIAAGFSPNRGYPDAPFMVDGYQPKNYGNKYSGWQSMRSALTKSLNVVAVKVLIDVGFDPVIKLARSMGIRSKLEPTYSMALGAYEVNLLELTSAYGTLATQGNAVEPRGIRRILDRTGKVLYDSQVKPKRVLDAGSASIVTWMLRSVVSEGTGRPAQLDRPVAGKTGTSEEARDLWFIGYIPQLVTGVWLGNDDSSPTWGTSGTAAYTWHEFMKEAVKGMPVQKFPEIPDNIEDRKGSIKAKPVQPSRTQTPPAEPSSEESSSSRRRYEEAPPESSYSEPAPQERRRSDPPPEEPPRAVEPPPADPAPAPAEPPASAPAPEPPQSAPDPAPPAADPLPPPEN